MNEDIAAAQRAIGQILAGLDIKTVICIDDIYTVGRFSVELAIGWLSTAKSQGKTDGWGTPLADVPLDASDDDVWKRALRVRWERLTDGERESVFHRLAKVLGYSDADIERDKESASLLRDLIPEDVSLKELGPAEWIQGEDTFLDDEKGTMCLFDHNLEYEGYATDFGISLLHKTIDTRGNRPVVCGLLTHTVREGEEISRSDQLADDQGLRREDFLVLSKDRLSGPLRFAHGLKILSLNYARDSLTRQTKDIAEEAGKRANCQLKKIDVYNFDYMVLRASEREGVWEAETLFRLFEVLRRDAFRKEAFSPDNRAALDNRIAQIRAIREVDTSTDEEYPLNQQWWIRRLELYEDGEFINQAHLPLKLGDIFERGQTRYILICQPCDLVVRSTGKRAAEVATLIKVTTPSQRPRDVSSFALDYFFPDSPKTAYAKFRSAYQISLDVLDLAVFNSDGQCMFDSSVAPPSLLHASWRKRYETISDKFQRHQSLFEELDKSLERTSFSTAAGEYLEKARTGRISRSNLDIPLEYEHGVFRFGLHRIGRCRQPRVARLLGRYVAFLSRDAEELDFAAPQ